MQAGKNNVNLFLLLFTYNVQVFLSFNFTENEMFTPLVVAELMKIIKDNPECF